MRERPILFSGPMVRAILEGEKTQTRRVMKPQPPREFGDLFVDWYHPTIVVRGEEQPGNKVYGVFSEDGEWALKCPFGPPGTRLWVRETWQPLWKEADPVEGQPHDLREWMGPGVPPGWYINYPATDGVTEFWDETKPDSLSEACRQSIHMPRWASRITLEVTEVRVQRLQDISNEDAWAEGCTKYDDRKYWESDLGGFAVLVDTPRDEFQGIWDSINAKRGFGWEQNPWVWAVSFCRVEAEGSAA